MRVPSTYAHADKLGADGRAALAGARLVWDRLTATMQRAIAECCMYRVRLQFSCRRDTARALAARGIVTGPARGPWGLTPLGLLVREAGTRSPKETS